MKMICANCGWTDGNVYTSIPPMYKCTITGNFCHGFHECDVEFAPVKHGKWIENPPTEAWKYHCSICGRTEDYKENYCPNCGAKMDEREE